MKKTFERAILIITALLIALPLALPAAAAADSVRDDEFFSRQWALKNDGGFDIRAVEAWDIYEPKTNNTVLAIIDTGIDFSHPDLANKVWTNTNELEDNGVDDDGNGYIDDIYGWNFFDDSNEIFRDLEDDHGTHCAGTVAAIGNNGVGIAGIVPDDSVKIMCLKALGANGNGNAAAVIAAIRYAEENGAQICNLSLGTTTFDFSLYLAMKFSKMLFVVACGNDGVDDDKSPTFPASYDLDNIISVANMTTAGKLYIGSNYGGKSVDIAAPGTGIFSTISDGRYDTQVGTSMSAPMVSAAAAMVREQFPGLNALQIKTILLASARTSSTFAGKLTSQGRLDLCAALSFDISTLDGYKLLSNHKQLPAGHTPELSHSTISSSEKNTDDIFNLLFSDYDNDLLCLCLMEGWVRAYDFGYGSVGSLLTPTIKNAVSFRIENGGIYTFYAVDAAGNQTVLTVELTPSGKHDYPVANDLFYHSFAAGEYLCVQDE